MDTPRTTPLTVFATSSPTSVPARRHGALLPARGNGRALPARRRAAAGRERRRLAARQRTHSLPSVTWMGHATVLVQMDGVTFLTDPIWSERRARSRGSGRSASSPRPCRIAALPPIDCGGGLALALRPPRSADAEDAAPRRARASSCRSASATMLRARASTGSRSSTGGSHGRSAASPSPACRRSTGASAASATRTRRCGPAGSSSADAPVLVRRRHRLLAGCSAEIGERLGGFDLAAVPIGAYDPPAMMQPVHMNPEEALQAGLDARAERAARHPLRHVRPDRRAARRTPAPLPRRRAAARHRRWHASGPADRRNAGLVRPLARLATRSDARASLTLSRGLLIKPRLFDSARFICLRRRWGMTTVTAPRRRGRLLTGAMLASLVGTAPALAVQHRRPRRDPARHARLHGRARRHEAIGDDDNPLNWPRVRRGPRPAEPLSSSSSPSTTT